MANRDKLVKSRHKDHRWLDKKFDIQGVVFLAGFRQYIEYVESLPKTYNDVDRAFYDAINHECQSDIWAAYNCNHSCAMDKQELPYTIANKWHIIKSGQASFGEQGRLP
ncbi:MAG: hypothetical protein Q8R88_14835 [Desulfoprunum sp.]|nr:hypothetical protein [Desulfoprunum sp.]